MAINKIHNEYAAQLGDLFAKAPKAVIAAVAVSSLTSGGDYLEEAQQYFLDEWRILFENGIVPQKPPSFAVSSFRLLSHSSVQS